MALRCLLPTRSGYSVIGMAIPARRSESNVRHLRPVPAPSHEQAPREISDEELIEAIVGGDGSQAGVLYDHLIGVVDRTLTRLFGRREDDHEDLVQASFEQIVLTLHRGRYARACSLKTWASAITSHVGMNALRSRRRERNYIDRNQENPEELPRHCVDGERQAMVGAEVERVRRHFNAMKPERAETLFLHDVLGHELAEIAVLMGVSVAAAQSRLIRGRKELRARLASEDAS